MTFIVKTFMFMQKIYFLLLIVFGGIFTASAQLVTTTPDFPLEGKEVTVVFDASLGSGGLIGYTGNVYAHTGVITNNSKNESDWKYAPSKWGDNSEKYKMRSLGNNKWEFKLTPSIREYYGVHAGETIFKMAFVFRSEDGSKTGKTADGGDIFIDVHREGVTVRFEQPDVATTLNLGDLLPIRAKASVLADMKLFVANEQIVSRTNVQEIISLHTFSQTGTFELRVEATTGGKTAIATQMVTVLGETEQGILPQGARPGINYLNDTQATLVLQAPGKRTVYVVGDFNDWQFKSEYQLKQDGEFFWITLSDLEKGKEYAFQYVVDGTIYIADPYADKVLDPWNDPYISPAVYPDLKPYPTGKAEGIVSVLQTGQPPYQWQVTEFRKPDRNQLMVYEMHIRDFTAEHSFSAAKDKLSYLKQLGINAIELMPVQEFDGNDSWGYNPCFFFALDKAYGTKKMYKDFIDACHKAGMAVIFDVVYNHATGSMPFAKLYWNSANNKTAPNNPYFNVDAPHPYSVFHDFNHESPLVRKFVKRNLQFLLNEYHIDGFRFDLTKGFTQAASTESSASNYDKSRIEILKDYHAAIKEVKPEAYVILEHFCDSKEEKELAEDGMHLWRNMNNAYCQTAMGWNDDSAFDGLYESIPAWIGFMESHDEERAAYKQTQWGDEALKTDLTTRMRQLEVNASFFFTVPGPKMIWQFGEMGYDVSIEENGRTGKKPLHWEYLENKDRKALHDSYSRLIKLRNDNPELFTSTSQFSWEVGTSNWGQGRFITLSSTTKHMLVAGNFSKTDGAYTVTFPVTGKWYDYLTGDEVEVKDATQKMEIPAHSYRILTTFPCLN